ncbi:hypothetical protein F8M41_014465 [Gigaspora margarita]|uniref:Uncharacterized protein n=1 Tax=Gigaspora margarita TaxID=4874 RepID=A0A8H3WYK2_GIGMA|nr:hypothetical protein F8M41_014465 [Gigaspora margarita]
MLSELELLRQHITELEAENAKLKQIIEKNTKHEAKNFELKSRVRELEARLALLEQSFQVVDEQPQNDKEVTSEVSDVDVPDSLSIHKVHSQLKLSEQIEEVPKIPDQEKISENVKTVAFWMRSKRKALAMRLGSVIGKRNIFKKWTGLIQKISRNFDKSINAISIQDHGTSCALPLDFSEISLTSDIMVNDRVGEKKAKRQIYDFIVQQFSDTKRDNLCKQTQRAIKIFDLFEKIGINKVQYIKTYSTNTDFQKVIDHFSNNSNSFTEPEISPTLGR